MWGVVLSLLGALAVGFLVRGGPLLWLSLLIGLAVFGGDPGDPLAALASGALTLVVLGALRALLRDRAER